MDITDSNKFYVYAYLNTMISGNFKYGEYEFEYEPFYIGKGFGNRFKNHLMKCYLKNDKNKFKVFMINEIINVTRNPPKIVFVKKSLLEKDAFELEKKLIKLIGRLDEFNGPLTNKNEGGRGGYRIYYTEESRSLLRSIRIGDKNPMYGKSGNLNPFFNKSHDDVTKEKWKEIRKGKQQGDKNHNWKYEYRIKNLETGEIIITKNLREFSVLKNIPLTSLKWAFRKNKIYKNIWIVERNE